jgi:hypothetical protein
MQVASRKSCTQQNTVDSAAKNSNLQYRSDYIVGLGISFKVGSGVEFYKLTI